MEGFFIEIKEKGRIVFALDVPVLDCIRMPAALSQLPEPIQWRHDGPGRYRAEHNAVVDPLGSPIIHHYELIARVHS